MNILEKYSFLDIQELRKIRGYRYDHLALSPEKIPETPGIYVWRFWPSISSLKADDFLEFIKNLQKTLPLNTSETLINYKTVVNIYNKPFGLDEQNILGVKNQKKINKILQLIKKDEDIKLAFAHTLELIIASLAPVYIGKANNIQSRLKQHFDNKTPLLKKIEHNGIKKTDIYISFIKDSLTGVDLTTTIEEIFQRLTNPSYTKRYG